MKKIIVLFLLTIVSCNAMKQKHKTKDKVEEQTQLSTKVELQTESQNQYKFTGRDSTAFKSDLKAETSFLSSLQNLKLTNNGKCVEPGETRFMEFADGKGNQYKIPVNDNTDLSFGNEAVDKKEITTLKQENVALGTKLNEAVSKNQALVKVAKDLVYQLEQTNTTVDAKTKKPVWYAFLFWCVIAIVLWETAKHYLIKLFI